MSFLCCSLTTAALTSLVLPICTYISKADPENVNYESCISILGSDPRSSISTAPQLARISFELDITRAKTISSTIDTLLKLSVSDPLASNALKDCSSVYSRIPGDLESGLEAIKDGDFDTASARVSAAMNAAITCEIGIKEKKGNIAPLHKEISEFYQLGAISLGFTILLRIIN
ncbi:hypothetical protein SOVF_073330 [Spinacia oleracea]|nr:hypothetical protein SOVF_073330 [Spinacia oleracea]